MLGLVLVLLSLKIAYSPRQQLVFSRFDDGGEAVVIQRKIDWEGYGVDFWYEDASGRRYVEPLVFEGDSWDSASMDYRDGVVLIYHEKALVASLSTETLEFTHYSILDGSENSHLLAVYPFAVPKSVADAFE